MSAEILRLYSQLSQEEKLMVDEQILNLFVLRTLMRMTEAEQEAVSCEP